MQKLDSAMDIPAAQENALDMMVDGSSKENGLVGKVIEDHR